ncbi:hypothetical protein H2198_000471 [Neophaeococcomyces mojaviensis]|uniref:Uncharacterized protein n=1 Tax=Neophaeococcomyces mojaviensis TaxID=3383035 RepID=A0ACC3AJJ3_9EURO|nr:hypothetical protein H2198_000471 [Knufia sp. JES_112]
MGSAIASLDSVSAGVSFLFYVIACFRQSFKDDKISGRGERWTEKLKKPKSKPIRPICYVHLLGNVVLFALSLTYAFQLAKSRHDELSMKADPDVSSILFGSLIWLIFTLGLTDSTDGADYEQYIPWMLSAVSYAITTAWSTAQPDKLSFNIAIQWARVMVLVALIITIPLFKRRTDKAEDHSVEETQPLIQSDEQNSNKPNNAQEGEDDDDEDDKSIISALSDESDNEEEEDPDPKKKEEKEQRKALRDRKWWQYIASFKIFIPFIRPRTYQQYFYLSVMVLNTIVARGVTLGLPLMLGAVIDDLTEHKFSAGRISAYVGLRFAASASGVHLIRNVVSFRLNTEMHNELTRHCFNHIMDLSADYHMSKSTPSTWQVMDRGQSVVTLLQDIFFRLLPVIADLFIALFVVGKLFGAYLCFVVATTMILLSWSNRVTLAKKTRMRRGFIEVWRNWYQHMSESFMHWRTVSEFNKISHEKGRHADKTKACTTIQIQQRQFRIYLDALQEAVVTIGFMLVCLIAASEIAAGRLDVGKFVVLTTYWSQIMDPVTTLAGSASNISEQLVDAEKLMLLLEKKPMVKSKLNAPKFVFKGGHVQVENCNFSYDNTRTVTNNVSFEAKPGETVALVGETGGGKSTIFNLLYRFFDPASGRVMVDGQDISQVDLESYRAVLGLVPQNPVLFNTTIMKNIRYSSLKAKKSEVYEASKAAQFHEKVEKFPKKYQQKVGELAQKLSGGELQRLAIARAILKQPGILLLDEATSAVDSVTESKIQAALDYLCKGKTTFVIAHRLSTIMSADKILVVKAGEIVECGSHKELLEHGNGAYQELWEAQVKLAAGKGQNKDDKSNKSPKPGAVVIFDDTALTAVGSEDGDGDKTSEGESKKDLDNTADDDTEDAKQAQMLNIVVGLDTPPVSRGESPTRNQEPQEYTDHPQQEDEAATEQDESSSIKSDRSKKDRDYGTL